MLQDQTNGPTHLSPGLGRQPDHRWPNAKLMRLWFDVWNYSIRQSIDEYDYSMVLLESQPARTCRRKLHKLEWPNVLTNGGCKACANVAQNKRERRNRAAKRSDGPQRTVRPTLEGGEEDGTPGGRGEGASLTSRRGPQQGDGAGGPS